MPEDGVFTTPTLLDLLRQRAEQYREKVVFEYSPSADQRLAITYRELDARARAIAATLQRQGAAGGRALILCPSGLDFIANLFGCMYAGAVAIPVHPPVHSRVIGRVASIVADAEAGVVLTDTQTQTELKTVVDDLPGGSALQWCAADALSPDAAKEWVAPHIAPSAPAIVQYTSGSTSSPKGVVLSHSNLLHNLEAIRIEWNVGDRASGVLWLPLHHDMGLIAGVLGMLYVGGNALLMPPTAFIERPMRWLEELSATGAIISGGPNFAYDLCVERSTAEERAAIDLSQWSQAYCGAEPVRSATLARFAEAFRPAGFRAEALRPVYGLAEATLFAAGKAGSAEPVIRHVDKSALAENRVLAVQPEQANAAPFVSCGPPSHGYEIVIADPNTKRRCPADEVGEIWISGPAVAQGYWHRPQETAETFSAMLADTGQGPFLRTGDLGFFVDDELCVAGRLKDLIIIRGRNYHPNDIESTVQDGHPALLRGRGAAFSMTPDDGDAEQLVVVQEIDASQLGEQDVDDVIAGIRTAITSQHEVAPHAVVLVELLRIPTTSSGKIRRSACRQRFLDGDLEVFAQWLAPNPRDRRPTASCAAVADGKSAPTAAEIAAWFVDQLSQELGLVATEVDTSRPFAYYGLDSVRAVRLTTALEAWLGREFSPTLAYDYPTIDLLSQHLAEDPTAGGRTAAGDDEARTAPNDPIAIIGIGCRFPGADGPAAFWRVLCDGVDAITDIPPDRWDADAYYHPDARKAGTTTTRWGGFLDQVDQFDPQFFGISPRESAHMDPQQRLLLEVAWEALEDAGQVPDRLAGTRTGVFVGISTNDYGNLQLGRPTLIDAYTGTGNALSIAANRLSYVYDFRGPSMAVDTACSSSLVAVHLACRSLRDGESTLALAGGANVILSPLIGMNFSKAGVMAADGRCKTFDAKADGYVRGEGAGIVVLKPLSTALADGDPIYAVIRGSATSQDGRTNGLMAPNRLSQEAVLAEAYSRADLSPGVVQYVEAHGSGTFLGDAIEAEALGAVLSKGRSPDDQCIIGSVKTNIGHLEAAAGVAGLIKVALALKNQAIPPSLNYTEPNPHIPFDRSPLRVAQTLTPWPQNGGRAVAGVSSFGFGGTNAHVVLAEAPQVRNAQPADSPARAELLPLSARSPEALTALAGRYRLALAAGTPLGDLCHTAGARRGHHDYRMAAVGDSPGALAESLSAFEREVPHPGLSAARARPGQRPQVVFVFSGQGSQWRGMGQQLYAEEPMFEDALNRCDTAMRPYLQRSILTQLFTDSADSQLTDIGVIQPAIFAVQVALAALWRSWGVEPAAVIGHSLGEVAAAHAAGALSLEDAARVICGRANLLRRATHSGAMVATELSLDEAHELIAGRNGQVSVAANNSHRSTVLSGEPETLTELTALLQQRGRFCRWVKVDVAAHSPQMNALREDLGSLLAGIRPVPASVPLWSTVTGDVVAGEALDAAYWVDNLCAPVRFSTAVRGLLDAGHDTMLELSPHPILLSAVREDADDVGRPCTLLPSIRRDEAGRATVLGSLGTLYTLGQPVAWEELHPWGGRCVPAPTYPWQRQRYWLDSAGQIGPAAYQPAAGGPVWRGPIRSSVHPDTVLVEIDLDAGLMPPLAEHRIQGSAVLPAGALLEIVSTAAAKAFGPAMRTIRDVEFHRPLNLSGTRLRTLQVVLQDVSSNRWSFECYGSLPGSSNVVRWSLLASGAVTAGAQEVGEAADPSVGDIQDRCTDALDSAHFYRLLADHGVDCGPSYQILQQIWRRDGEAIARLTPASDIFAARRDLCGPALTACFQVLGATLPSHDDPDRLYLPAGLTELTDYDDTAELAWCHAVLRSETGQDVDDLAGDVTLLDQAGRVAVAVRGVLLKRVPADTFATRIDGLRDKVFEQTWRPAVLTVAEAGGGSQPLGVGGRWLIFGNQGPVLDALTQHLTEGCVVVEPGTDFKDLGSGHYRIDPMQPRHFRQLLDEAFGGSDPRCRGVLHLWSLRAAPPDNTSTDWLASARALGVSSVLHLVQVLADTAWAETPRLWLVTSGAQATRTDDTTVSVAQASLWGMGRTIQLEHPELRCSRIDLGIATDTRELVDLVREVSADGREADVALRGHRRYVARLTLHDGADNRDSAWHNSVAVPPDGIGADATYLITGGFGGLGRVVATWLVDRGARHLVLMGRGRPSAAAQVTIDRLRSRGIEVKIARGDVTSAEQLAAVLEKVRAAMPPIRGVFHAAGILDDGVLYRLDARRVNDVMAPKVEGAWHLHMQTCDDPLDYFVLFSSAAALLGSPGQAHYAAGNAFLDALAWHRRAEGRPALSVNWGPLSDVGFAERLKDDQRLSRHGMQEMPVTEGLAALTNLLQLGAIQAAVMSVDWSRLRSEFGSTLPLFDDLPTESEVDLPDNRAGGADLRNALRGADPQERRRQVESYLRDQTAVKLSLAPARLDITTPLNYLGVDSLIATELRTQIERDLGIVVPVVELLDGPSIASLAGWLNDHLDDETPATQVEWAPPPQAADPVSSPWIDMLNRVPDASDDDVDKLLRTVLATKVNEDE